MVHGADTSTILNRPATSFESDPKVGLDKDFTGGRYYCILGQGYSALGQFHVFALGTWSTRVGEVGQLHCSSFRCSCLIWVTEDPQLTN